jgi:hypothetical protein
MLVTQEIQRNCTNYRGQAAQQGGAIAAEFLIRFSHHFQLDFKPTSQRHNGQYPVSSEIAQTSQYRDADSDSITGYRKSFMQYIPIPSNHQTPAPEASDYFTNSSKPLIPNLR